MKDNGFRQEWFCDKCETKGTVILQSNESPMDAIALLGGAYRTASPDCENGRMTIRIISSSRPRREVASARRRIGSYRKTRTVDARKPGAPRED